MKLSVVIVNYNVQYFLEQCLHSVYAAATALDTEVLVVDNHSVDGSVNMLKQKFPSVTRIENKKNVGFARANNQAIQIAKGEYILLLNPDTVVEENTFIKVIQYMDAHPDAGGLGVKMLDGKGNFLPESKRGLPTPMVAFYKIFGLSRLFPKSKTFGKYHLGYLDKNQIHAVDVLSGAFMLLRKATLEKVGLLDEAFFMYGEDIDLSYRITQAGFKNYYFPETRIIHYKGESTKKSSVNYVFVFYKAMVIFAQKHFSKQQAGAFSFLIHLAIYLRASLALLSRFCRQTALPFTDALLFLAGMFLLKEYYHEFTGIVYPHKLILIAFPVYVLIWSLAVFVSGGYDKPIRLIRLVRGILIGTIVILIAYSLLNESYRFSRALILLGTLWAILASSGLRILLHLSGIKTYQIGGKRKKRLAIVGEEEESKRVEQLLKETSPTMGFIVFVSSEQEDISSSNCFVAKISQLKELISIFTLDEVIFCAKNLSAQQIIQQMLLLEGVDVEFKIAPPESWYLIGSSSLDASAMSRFIGINAINKSINRRNKRMLDFFLAFLFLLTYPVLFLVVKHPFYFLKNIIHVFTAKKSWVGYIPESSEMQETLPSIKKSVLTPYDAIAETILEHERIHQLNLMYAKDYKVANDLAIIWKGVKKLGNTSEKDQGVMKQNL